MESKSIEEEQRIRVGIKAHKILLIQLQGNEKALLTSLLDAVFYYYVKYHNHVDNSYNVMQLYKQYFIYKLKSTDKMDSFCVGIYPADALQRARKNVTSSVHRIQSVINVSRKWNLKALKKNKESQWGYYFS